MLMATTQEWFIDADDVAMAALPTHLEMFVATPETSYQSALLPVVLGEDQWLLCAYCDHTGPGFNITLGVPRTIYAPRVLQWVAYPSGDFRWEEPIPDAHGLTTASQDDFGIRLGPIQRDHIIGNEWHEAGMQYLPLVLRVVEQRWLVTRYTVTPEEQETARALQHCVRALYDAPLLPFYRHYGSHFLAWIERAAK